MATSTYRANQFGSLQPLVSDLLTADPLKNKYMAQTYSGDTDAVKSRLNEYNVYDTTQLGGLSDYFKSLAPAATGNQLYMKPEDFTTAQSKLAGVKDADWEAMNPMLGGLSSLGSYNGSKYYDKAGLDTALGKYQSADLGGLSALNEFKGLNPVASVAGKSYYEKDPLNTAIGSLGNYGALTSADREKVNWLPNIGDLKPLANYNGTDFYNKDALQSTLGQLNNYEMLNTDQYNKFSVLPEFASLKTAGVSGDNRFYNQGALGGVLGQYSSYDPASMGSDVFSRALASKGINLGGQQVVKTSNVDYYKNLANSLNGSRIGYYGVNAVADPWQNATYNWMYPGAPSWDVSLDDRSYVYTPYEAAARLSADRGSNTLKFSNDLLVNPELLSRGQVVRMPQNVVDTWKSQLWDSDFQGSDYSAMMQDPGLGYLLSRDDYNNYVINRNTPAFDYLESAPNYTWDSGHGNVSTANDLYGAWMMRNSDVDLSGVPGVGAELESSPWIAQSPANAKTFYRYDPNNSGNSGMTSYDQWIETHGGGGWLGEFSDFMRTKPLGQVIGAVLNYYSGGLYSAGLAVGNGVQTGDWGDAILPIAMAVIGNTGGAESLGNTVSNGALTGTGAAMLGSGIIGAGSSLIQGKGLGDALKSGALGALGSGAGAALGGALNGAVGGSTLGDMASKAGQGALTQLITSGGDLKSALYGGLGGAMGAAGKSLSNYLTTQQGWSPNTAKYVGQAPGALTQYMMSKDKQKDALRQALMSNNYRSTK